MAEITLTATTGRPVGSRSSKRMRAEGKVPAVVYGLGREPLPVSVDWRELRSALITDAGVNALIDLEIEGEGEAQLSIIKEMQRHPIRHTVDHVDFLLIRRDQAITVDVPIVLEGDAEQVTREQGMIEHLMQLLPITAKPDSIPDQITYDITELAVGQTITVGDLALPAGVTTDIDLEEAVATAQVSRAALEAEAEADAAEAAEAEGGAAPAPSGDGDDAAEGDEG